MGASAAGLYAAHLLARAGARVCVLEAGAQLNPAARTLIVTPQLRDLLGPLAERCIVNLIHRFELFADGKAIEIQLESPDLVVERTAIIHHLAQQVRSSGGEICFGRRFVSLHEENSHLRVVHQDSSGRCAEQKADVVVGADGACSKVAKEAGWPPPLTVPLIQVIVEPPEDLDPTTTRVWFAPEDTPYFYWLIPESRTKAALGLIAEDGSRGLDALKRFAARHGLRPQKYQAARIPLYTGWTPIHRRLGGGDVYLVGDAVAHVKVTTVGGIVTGFWGAQAVAEAILNGKHSQSLAKLKGELNRHLLLRKALHGFSEKNYSHLFDLLTPRTRRCLTRYHRDQTSNLLWNLCLRQPRLFFTGIQSLLANGSFPASPSSKSLDNNGKDL